ncbi:MAG: EAL domain-containing protein [Pseudomonadota bacterium]
MSSSYELDLVVLSIIVAMMASYGALDLAGRVTQAQGRVARQWLVGGAMVMGAGIWSMHFIGMLAFHLPTTLGYDLPLTAVSLVIAIVTSGFALAVASGKDLRLSVLLAAGVIMGAGICGMHYTGMAAMRMSPPIVYNPLLFSASVAVAVTASIAALWLAFSLRADAVIHRFEFRLLAAMVMGFAITGMHYTGMAAAEFAPGAICTVSKLAVGPATLGYSIGAVMAVILLLIVSISAREAPPPPDAGLDPAQERRRELEEKALRIGVVALGVAIALLSSFAVWTVESKKVTTTFQEAARDHVNNIIEGFDESEEVVESLAMLYHVDDRVTRQQFRAFASELLARVPWVQALEWIPRVRREDRAQYEAAMRVEFPGFRISAADAQSGPSTAKGRDEYFPVHYVEPLRGNEAEQGLDLGSDAESLAAMHQARDSGSLATVGRVAMGGEWGFRTFLPIYLPGQPHDTVEQRRANLLGFVGGEFHAGQMVEKNIARRTASGLDLELYAGPEAIAGQRLYTHYSRTRPPGPIEASDSGLRTAISFSEISASWTYVATAAPGRHAVTVWGALLTLLGVLAAAAFADANVRMRNSLLKLTSTQRELAGHMTELKISEDRFRTLVEEAGDGILIISPEDRFLDLNQRSVEMLGYSREELVGADVAILLTGTERAKASPELANVRTGRPYQSEWLIRRKDGSTFPSDNTAKMLSDGRVLILLREVTERKQQEEKIYRLNRIHAVLSGINSLIVRTRDRTKLFQEICRLLVERGHFKLAWVGLVSDGEVRPVTFHGSDGGALQSVRISMQDDGSDSHDNRSLTAQALRERRAVICNDIARDERTQHWPAASRNLGFGSFLSLPLYVGKQVAGCFNLYAIEPGFFDSEEVKILTELSANISYALEFIAKEQQLGYITYYDTLTRLANRDHLLERLPGFLQTARQARKPLALLELDIDNFKSVNDTLGRDGGDEVLKQLAARMTLVAGGSDHLARTAGDRFALLLDDFQDNDGLVRFVEHKLLPQINRPMTVAGKELRVSVRLGIARFAEDGDDPESLLRNAEAAVKRAKQSNERYLFYTQEIGATFSEKLNLESQLRRAIEKNEFVLYYQPKVDLRSGTIVGAEALIRWNSPDLGLVPPSRFIPLLEETGMILPVGGWAMVQAVKDHRRWLAEELLAPPVAVNVSPVQLRQKDFVEVVHGVLSEFSGDRPCLDLEITESTLIGDIEEHIAKLKAVRDLGVQIAIDDFGTGFSSLSYLVRLPINTLKIDRSFVLRMGDSADTMSVVSTILTLAHSMNLKVVAEGVDSEEQLKFLRLLRCDQIQGWLFSKAVPADEFAQLLREDRRLGQAPKAAAVAGAP